MFKTRQKTDYMLLRRLTELHKTLQIISEVIPAEGNAVFQNSLIMFFFTKDVLSDRAETESCPVISHCSDKCGGIFPQN